MYTVTSTKQGLEQGLALKDKELTFEDMDKART